MSRGPQFLYGIHDPGGEWLMKTAPGTIVYTMNVVESPIDFTPLAAQGYRALVRLNHSHHGAGTIPPKESDWPAFARACADYVAACKGVRDFTLGNEPNLRVEWGREEPILPVQYAFCYNLVHAAVKARTPGAQLSPAAIGPWNVESGVEWVEYFRQMLGHIPHKNVDFLCLHTYSRGYSPGAVTDNGWMDSPHHHRHRGFRAYKDFLDAVPDGLRHLPVDIKESNGNESWPNSNTGWVQAAYAEIHRHNTLRGTQKIRSLCLFRWPQFDERWQFETKPGVHADFAAAVAQGYAAPDAAVPEPKPGPAPKPDPKPDPAGSRPEPAGGRPEVWDARLDVRGTVLRRAEANEGSVYRLLRGTWRNESESGGRHHVFVDVRDEAGRRMSGVVVRLSWPDGHTDSTTNTGKGDDHGVDFPMFKRAPAYSVSVEGAPSDVVEGLGLGSVEAPHHNIHTSYHFVFQRQAARSSVFAPTVSAGGASSHVVPRQPEEVPEMPTLVHPVQNPAHRRVTQAFGARPEFYRQYTIDGVPLLGHEGIDFGTPMNSTIVAVADGRVVETADQGDKGYGRYVKLEHTWGESVYAHLQRFLVVLGATVSAGQPIALSGNTGNSDGAHLHLGIRVRPFNRRDGWGGYSDPAKYLPTTGSTPPPAPTGDIVGTIRAAAREFNVDEELLLSQAWAENSFNPTRSSSAGAMGLLQVMPNTWNEWAPRVGARDPLNPRDNARVAARYMRWLLEQLSSYGANATYMALIAYGWGIGNLTSGKAEPPQIWRTYAAKIVHGRDLLKAVKP